MEILGSFFIGLAIFLGTAGTAFLIFWRKIPLIHVGVITIAGERRPLGEKYIKREGWRFFADFWPIFYGFNEIKVEKVSQKIVLEDVRCRQEQETGESENPRSGGELSVTIEVTWQPDYIHESGRRLYTYMDSGRENGIREIIAGMIEEDVRQVGREMSWEQFSFGTDELVKGLVKKLTGEEPVSEDHSDFSSLLHELETNGFPDVVDLGIIIRRFNVGRIKERGELAKAADAQARESQERRAEIFEIRTEIEQAKILLEGFKKVGQETTFQDCLLEIRRRKTIREGRGAVYDIPGISDLLSGIKGKVEIL